MVTEAEEIIMKELRSLLMKDVVNLVVGSYSCYLSYSRPHFTSCHCPFSLLQISTCSTIIPFFVKSGITAKRFTQMESMLRLRRCINSTHNHRTDGQSAHGNGYLPGCQMP